MKKIYIVALVSALLCGVLFFWFLSGYDKKESTESTQKVPKVDIVVPVAEIPENTKITQELLQVIKVSADAVNASSARKMEDVVGKFSSVTLYPNEQILAQKLYDKDSADANALSLKLEKGMRAMTISVDTTSGVGGYICAGDHVDILAENGSKEPREVVESVKVIKVGNRLYNETGEIYSDITFELSKEDCKKIYAAQIGGGIRLLLREKTDE